MTVFEVRLQTLTPLHIGDGEELRQDMDFSVHEGHTFRLNPDEILKHKEARWRSLPAGRIPLPGALLDPADYQNPRYFRYRLAGVPRSAKTDARVKSFIKDGHDRPYIPGSSLKGALRTALAWTGWEEVRPRLDRNAVGRNRAWAGQPLERKLFGPDPNHDLLRALHVSDLFLSAPDGAELPPGSGLILVNAQVLTKRDHGSPVELEALAGDRAFTGSLTVDDSLFTAAAERELHFSNRKHWLDELIPRVNAHSRARIAELTAWFESAENCSAIANFYRQLGRAALQPNQALIQIGWGAGWDGKTFGTRLQASPELFERLVGDFRLHKAAPGSPPRRVGDPFPRSKRAAMRVKDKVATPAAPFGWVLLELNPRARGG